MAKSITDVLFKNLSTLLLSPPKDDRPFVILNEQYVRELYSALTGFQHFPKAEVQTQGSSYKASLIWLDATTQSSVGRTCDISPAQVYMSLRDQLVKRHGILPSKIETIRSHTYFWVKGNLIKTCFPDGIETIQIDCKPVPVILTTQQETILHSFESYMQSRFFEPTPVSGLIFAHSKYEPPSQQGIYGDGSEHTYIVATPVALQIER